MMRWDNDREKLLKMITVGTMSQEQHFVDMTNIPDEKPHTLKIWGMDNLRKRFEQEFKFNEVTAVMVCTDTDKGMNPETWGAVNDNTHNQIKIDNCVGDTLIEYYCTEDNVYASETIPCENGCAFGKCKTAPEAVSAPASISTLGERTRVSVIQVKLDLNDDRKIDYKDQSLFDSAYRKRKGSPGFLEDADVNGDNVVDSIDRALWGKEYNLRRNTLVGSAISAVMDGCEPYTYKVDACEDTGCYSAYKCYPDKQGTVWKRV